MDDLAAWLTQIWDEAEKAARFTIEITEHSYPADEFQIHWGWSRLANHRTSGGGGASLALGAPSPSEVIARIAADRKILALHHPDRPLEGWYWTERVCAGCGRTWHKWLPDKPPTEIGPEQGCPTVRLLALPYADRPGYQEAWKPE